MLRVLAHLFPKVFFEPWHGNQATRLIAKTDQPLLDPQIAQIRKQIGTRIPDAVLLSDGGNDINFSAILEKCLAPFEPCEDPGVRANFESQVATDELKLAQGLNEVANCLSSTGQACIENGKMEPPLKMPPGSVWISEYFDPTRDQNGQFCDYAILPPFSDLSHEVFQWANGLIAGLNATIQAVAAANGWQVLPASEFLDHGLCAQPEGMLSGNWVNTWQEDYTHQGDKYGFFHPNNYGQEAYERVMQSYVAPTLDLLPPTGSVPGAPNQVQAATGVGAVRAATVSWSPPDTLADTVQRYTVTSYPGGYVVSGGPSDTSATVTGLTPGVKYSFTVTATNAAGTGPASAASNAVIPLSVAPVSAAGSAFGPFPDPALPATASLPSLSATATGDYGSVQVATYPSDPVAGIRNGQSYFDVSVGPGSTFTSLTFTDCGIASGDVVQWWDPSLSPPGWQDIPSDRIASTPAGCVTVTVPSAGTPPTLADLTGTVFAIARTDTDLAIGPVGNITAAATSSAGAPVLFTTPTGTDGSAVVDTACNYASGETFPVGATTVWCGVTDEDDTPSFATTSFVVTVTLDQAISATGMSLSASGLATLRPPVVVSTANSSFNAVGKPTVNPQTGAVTFTEMVSDQGTFSWALSFKNGTFGAFSATKETRCKKGQVKLKGKCRPSTIVFGTGSKIIAAPGIVSFTVKPSASASKTLKTKQGLSVTAILSYQSAHGGGPVSHVVSLTDKLTRKQKGKK